MCQICSKPCFNVNFKQVSHCRLWTTKCRMSSFCSSANQWWFHHKYFPRKYPKVSQKLFCIALSMSFFCVIEFNPWRYYIYIYIKYIVLLRIAVFKVPYLKYFPVYHYCSTSSLGCSVSSSILVFFGLSV